MSSKWLHRLLIPIAFNKTRFFLIPLQTTLLLLLFISNHRVLVSILQNHSATSRILLSCSPPNSKTHIHNTHIPNKEFNKKLSSLGTDMLIVRQGIFVMKWLFCHYYSSFSLRMAFIISNNHTTHITELKNSPRSLHIIL